MVPIKKLQVATKNIKEGNLDFTIDYDEPDEMGDLCRNFEDMRKRLKESTEETGSLMSSWHVPVRDILIIICYIA